MKQKEEINYYKVHVDGLQTIKEPYIRTFEAVLLQKPNQSPAKVWIKDSGKDAEWHPLRSPAYVWWYDWFKTIQRNITEHKKLTKEELFEEIGIDLL